MSTIWVVVVLLGAAAKEPAAEGAIASATAAAAEEPLVKPRSGAKLRDAAREALRHWARPSSQQAEQAAREFLLLYNELRRDDELSRTEREQLAAKIRSRLANLAEQIQRRAGARGGSAASAKQTAAEKSDRPQSVGAAAQVGDVLAQRGGRGGQVGGWGGMGPGGPAGNGRGAFGGTGGAQADDYGQDLVELIRRTIAPNTWDVHGGPGSIYYWRPGRALVIRAAADVHDDVGGVLEQLQRAGR